MPPGANSLLIEALGDLLASEPAREFRQNPLDQRGALRDHSEPGAVLAIQLGEIWSEFSSVVIAEVRHCSAIAKDRWLIGCVVPRGLSMDDILALAGETPVVDYPD